MKLKRTHLLNELSKVNVGDEVNLNGFVNRRRDHGGLIFVDLRDKYGITQVVFDPEAEKSAHEIAESIRSEWVIAVKGVVRERPEGMRNEKMETGEIEVLVNDIEILSKAKTTPFEIDSDDNVSEELRLKYRYLDIRREKMKNNIQLRHDMIKFIRDYMCDEGFTEVETPILIKGTPEGSREYIVPSRLYNGNFYVLPQSPQQLKQLLMVAGMDKYFQIARCFRDEDQRGDRQPEFTQLDMEMSFVDENDVMTINQNLLIKLIEKFKPQAKLTFEDPIVMTYHEAMNNYGSDKPDLRFEMKIKDVTDVFKDSKFDAFASHANSERGVVKALKLEGKAAEFSRKDVDDLTEVAKIYKAKGLAHIKMQDGELKSPILKFLSESEISKLQEVLEMKDGDIAFFTADEFEVACESIGQVRLAVARRFNLLDDSEFAICWVTNFPMFEKGDGGSIGAMHHPFTSPNLDELELLDENPLKVNSRAYDLVMNGSEIGGGSIRIHDQDLQAKVFDLLGISKEDAELRFGHILEAFSYGVPPHGGIAWGLDRVIMLFAEEPNIREVIAFPKDSKAKDLMLGAPSKVDQTTIDESGIKVVE
jgi:aspartyl-tRNA synthetase